MATKVVTTDAGGSTEVLTITIDDTIPASDNFSGVDPNSGSVGDTRYNQRWTDPDSGLFWTITSSELVGTVPNVSDAAVLFSKAPDLSGDFVVTLKYNFTAYDATGPNGSYLRLDCDTTNNNTIWNNIRDGGSTHVLKTEAAGGGFNETNTTTFSGYFRIKRTSGTIYCQHSTNGTSYTTLDSGSDSGDITEIAFYVRNFNASGSGTTTGKFGEITIEDGDGNAIQIDIGTDTVGVVTIDA